MDDSIHTIVDAIAIEGFRSFTSGLCRIGPFDQVNVFAGPNNSGKSNLLRLLAMAPKLIDIAQRPNRHNQFFSSLDRTVGSSANRASFGFGIRPSHSRFEAALDSCEGALGRRHKGGLKKLKELLQAAPLLHDCVWFTWQEGGQLKELQSRRAAEFIGDESAAQEIARHIAFCSGRTGGEDCLLAFMDMVQKSIGSADIGVVTISASRRTDVTEPALLERLADLMYPEVGNERNFESFERLERFLQTVTEHPFKLEMPKSQEYIIVSDGHRRLPLTSLGTGIHQVIMMAAAITVESKKIICVEEPELHLHARLQRQFLEYLLSDSSNQYFIATHSAHFLDNPRVRVFSCGSSNGSTTVECLESVTSHVRLRRELGYRPSDLLQSNCILWVEGPSDRIYLKRWIEIVDPELAEGVHFSIMFYGGRLLSHVSVGSEEVEGFIELLRINQRAVVIIDSDKGDEADEINVTKARIRDEMTADHGHVWVTEGREIENLVPADVFSSALEALAKGCGAGITGDRWAKRLPAKELSTGETRILSKIDVAEAVAARMIELQGELRGRVEELVRFIRESCS